MAIDSHMHINSKVITDISGAIDAVNNDESLSHVINVGLDIVTSRECVDIARDNHKFYSSIGIHPLYVDGQSLDELCKTDLDKVVAIGEIGLDTTKNNYYDQRDYLIRQILIANMLELPVIIHSNNSNKKIIEIFEKYAKPKYGCVFHCFQPDLEDLSYLINNGFYISFAGRVTYKTARKSIDVLKAVPEELFLVETDSPFLIPEPLRSSGITESKSSDLHYIIERIAEIKGVSSEYIENITSENVKRLFKRMN